MFSFLKMDMKAPILSEIDLNVHHLIVDDSVQPQKSLDGKYVFVMDLSGAVFRIPNTKNVLQYYTNDSQPTEKLGSTSEVSSPSPKPIPYQADIPTPEPFSLSKVNQIISCESGENWQSSNQNSVSSIAQQQQEQPAVLQQRRQQKHHEQQQTKKLGSTSKVSSQLPKPIPYQADISTLGPLSLREDNHITSCQFSQNRQSSSQDSVSSIAEQQQEQPAVLQQCQQQKHQERQQTTNRWTHAATLYLIEQWAARRARFENNSERNDAIWDEIAQLLEENGFSAYSSHRCENRFKYLKRLYMNIKDSNKRITGGPQRTCPYYEEFDEIFARSPQVDPPALASSRDPLRPNPIHSPQDETNQTHNQSTIRRSRPTRLNQHINSWMREFRLEAQMREEARERRHRELLQLQIDANNTFKEVMQKIIDKLN